MKRVNRILAVIVIGILVFTTACEKTEPDVNTNDRDKFIGTWDGQSDGPGGHRNFSLIISASSSAPDQIKMQNFDGGTGTVFATVSGDLFSIPSQLVSGETIKGDGSYSNSNLSFSFTIDDGQTVEDRTGTANNKH
jgi:hypothetical protein